MLYKFKSKAAGDVVMLQDSGTRVLQLMGKDTGPTGIVLPEHMAAAIEALTQAIAQDEAQRQAAKAAAKEQGVPSPALDTVSLRVRAWPLVEMMQRCAKANAPITWGV
jgi:Domain of unknown function (DUF1840)